jgi:hypothetical protein
MNPTCLHHTNLFAFVVGGVYIPFVNAARVLSSVIASMVTEQLTFHQTIRRTVFDAIEENSSFRYSYMKNRVHGMINECQTMNDVRSLFYNHRLVNKYNNYSSLH